MPILGEVTSRNVAGEESTTTLKRTGRKRTGVRRGKSFSAETGMYSIGDPLEYCTNYVAFKGKLNKLQGIFASGLQNDVIVWILRTL